MVDERADGEMIEIGDPDEEPKYPDPSPRVLIEYRERGVPWMLIPPLLVISALGAVLLYHKVAPQVRPPQPPQLVKAVVTPDLPESKSSSPVAPINPPPAPVPVAVEKPAQLPAIAATPDVPPVEPVDTPELVPEPAKVPVAAPFPRVQGLGFDPKALEAERKAEAPPDPSLAVAQEVRPDGRDQPREVDPDLLPPDPRLARVRQMQRLAEAIRKAEEDRSRFHADLAKVCKKFGERSGPEIKKLFDRYENQVEPAAQKKAALLLGKTGMFVGADRASRIALLRNVGFPEPAILVDIYEQVGKDQSKAVRGGLNSNSEVMYYSALYLLKNPPRVVNPSRPASSARASAGERPVDGPGASSPAILAAPTPGR